MTERYNSEDRNNLIALSRNIEDAWRIVSRPYEYSPTEVDGAELILITAKKDFLQTLKINTDEDTMEMLKMVMLGLYHYR